MQFISLTLLVCLLLISMGVLADANGVSGTGLTVTVDGSDQGRVYDGRGGLSAGANSRLLIDYPEPQRSQVLDFLFKPHFGASLQVLKVEMGGTMNSTWGSEPSHANTRDELEHPKPEYYDRGYEWWLLKEAKKRNPNIITESLQWGIPSWIGNGNFYSQENIDYIIKFIKGARDHHGVTIDYQGILNEDSERAKHKSDWIKALRKALDENGLQHVKLVGTDSVGDHGWDIVPEMEADPDLSKAIYAVGVHYVDNVSSDAAKNCGKPLWDSEMNMVTEPWVRADSLARVNNLDYVIGRMTMMVFCSIISSNFDYLECFGQKGAAECGFMIACTPWSGHYVVPAAIWATAHTTQFTEPGWRYMDGGCGFLKEAGSYVALRSPDGSGDYSIIIETMKGRNKYTNWNWLARRDSDPMPDVPTQRVTFRVKNLSEGPLHVWRTNRQEQFVQLPDMTPKDGCFTLNLEGNSIYSLTTTTGQRKGSYDIPKDSPFPMPYKDDFESYAVGKTPKYLSDEQGTFAVAHRSDGSGKCLRQIVPQKGMYGWGYESPWAIIGDAAWKDYEASVDVHIEEKGFAGIYGRVDEVMTRAMPGGYALTIDHSGTWQLKDTTTVIESGKIKTTPSSWHNLKLRFKGPHIIAAIDGDTVCSIMEDFHKTGPVALVSSFEPVEFDNFTVQPFKGRTPEPIAQWQNLATGAKATASKELDADHAAAKAIDLDHQTGWCPAAGKTSGEWLEIDLGKPVTFDRTIIDQHKVGRYSDGIAAYKIQYWNGTDWKDLVVGKSMALRQTNDFSPVTAEKVRLLITECGEYSCVYEFQICRHKR